MPGDTIGIINQILGNFQVKLKDAGEKLCDKSWRTEEDYFPYDSIGYIREGRIFLKVGERESVVERGGLYYIPAMTCYSHHVLGDTATVCWTHFELSTGGRTAAVGVDLPVSVSSPSPEATEILFEGIFRSRRSGILGAPMACTGYMCQLAAHYFAQCGERAALRGTGKTEKMKQVAEFIRENLEKNLTVELLAAQAGLHPNYFIREFQRFFQEPPIRFVLGLREERAREMLEHSDLSVKEIGISLGFSNQNYFSEFFKKRSGYSPSEYRELKGKK